MLIGDPATTGGRAPKSQPPEHAATSSAADTSNTARPPARRTAAHPAPIWAIASATGLAAGASRSMSAPALACRSSRANPARIGSACAANRANHPRTVEAGRSAAAQIRRHPEPAARATSAAQITVTASTRRPSQNRGRSTCERPHPPAPSRSHAVAGSAGLAHEPRHGVPPRRQPPAAIRAGQLAGHQLHFDTGRIRTYPDQRTACSRVRTALPDSLTMRTGRAVDSQEHAESSQPSSQ